MHVVLFFAIISIIPSRVTNKSIVYSCDELAHGVIAVGGFRSACVVLEENTVHSNAHELFLTDGQDTVSFAEIARDKSHCTTTEKSWTFKSTTTALNCDLEFILILSDVAPYIIPVLPVALPITIGDSVVLVSPRGIIRFTDMKGSDNSITTFYSGIGNGEESVLLANFTSTTFPHEYFAFNPVMTIQSDIYWASFTVSTSTFHRDYLELKEGETLAISSCGKASNVHKKIGNAHKIDLIPHSENSTVRINVPISNFYDSSLTLSTFNMSRFISNSSIDGYNSAPRNLLIDSRLVIGISAELPSEKVGSDDEVFFATFTNNGNDHSSPKSLKRNLSDLLYRGSVRLLL